MGYPPLNQNFAKFFLSSGGKGKCAKGIKQTFFHPKNFKIFVDGGGC